MLVITLNHCILKKNPSILGKHAKLFAAYTAECGYQLDFRIKDKEKPTGYTRKTTNSTWVIQSMLVNINTIGNAFSKQFNICTHLISYK